MMAVRVGRGGHERGLGGGQGCCEAGRRRWRAAPPHGVGDRNWHCCWTVVRWSGSID